MSSDEESRGLEFVQYFRITPENLRNSVGTSPQQQGKPQPPLEKEYDPNIELIDLPPIDTIKTKDIKLRDAIIHRRSIRNFTEEPPTIDELSWLLYATQGIQSTHEVGTIWVTRVNNCRATLRPVVSGGAIHPFETYLLIRNCKGLKKGLYRYIASRHKLFSIDQSEDINERISKGCLNQTGKNAPILFIWTAIPSRSTWHYGDLGYWAIYVDIGHVSQQLYLAAEDVGDGVCTIAWYDADALEEALDVDGSNEYIVLTAAVGKRPEIIIDP